MKVYFAYFIARINKFSIRNIGILPSGRSFLDHMDHCPRVSLDFPKGGGQSSVKEIDGSRLAVKKVYDTCIQYCPLQSSTVWFQFPVLFSTWLDVPFHIRKGQFFAQQYKIIDLLPTLETVPDIKDFEDRQCQVRTTNLKSSIF